MLVPEHKECDICGRKIAGRLPDGVKIRKTYYTARLSRSPLDNAYVCEEDELDICDECWNKMIEYIKQKKEE